MRGAQVAQAIVGVLLLAAVAYWARFRTIGWTAYTPASTEKVELPAWPIVVVLAVTLFLMFIWDAAGKRTRKK